MLVLFLDFSRQVFDVKNIMESNWMKAELMPMKMNIEPQHHPFEIQNIIKNQTSNDFGISSRFF